MAAAATSTDRGILKAITSNITVNYVPNQDFIGGEITNSLPLQMSLYFNVLFSPLWFSATLLSAILKQSYLHEVYQAVSPTVFGVMTVMELVRLYCGYKGNLHERVPMLAAFWMLTILIQLPMCAFVLFNSSLIRLPIEISVHAVLLAFLIFEIIVSTITIRDMSAVQKTKFNLLLPEEIHDKRD